MITKHKNRTKKNLFILLLSICLITGGNVLDSRAALAEEPVSQNTTTSSYYSNISSLQYISHGNNYLTFSWSAVGNNTGFYVYRKTTFEPSYQLLDTIPNKQDTTDYISSILQSGVNYSYTDTAFRRGIIYTYKVVAYQENTITGQDGTVENQVTELALATKAWKLPIAQGTLVSVKRSGKTKAKVQWSKLAGVDGYEIYTRTSDSSYRLARRIAGAASVKCTISNVSQKKNTAYKVRGYVKQNGKYAYGSFSLKQSLEKLDTSKIALKFKQLQKQFPSGKYWNHVGKSHFSSSTVTNKPCHHGASGIASTCNYYNCPDGKTIGYQCYGFAWKMSDLIYGKSAKIKNFYSFSKCKAGDVIRYSGHSVIIVSKHSGYIIAGECNYGDTCVIKWGRKIYKSELAGAKYSRRYK